MRRAHDAAASAGLLGPARTIVAAAWLGAAVGAAPAQDEVPFITTPDRVTVAMLELAGVAAGDHVIDLGSGDGRIVITAARRFGASGLGVEIVPELVQKSRANARAAGVAERVDFRVQDLFATDLTRATVVTMYLLPEVNLQLRPRLLALAPGTRIVSHDWDMGEWVADRTLTLEVPDKTIGREKKSQVFLWVVPARVHGTWCSGSGSDQLRLELTQRFQRFSATLLRPAAPAPVAVFDGRIDSRGDGTTLRSEGPAAQAQWHLAGATLQLVQMSSAGGAYAGRQFIRAGPAGC
jgi:SAM-dependent methyltransferase